MQSEHENVEEQRRAHLALGLRVLVRTTHRCSRRQKKEAQQHNPQMKPGQDNETGSTGAYLALACVYSCAQNTVAVGGKGRNLDSEAHIWSGVPSKSRPQPIANRVSPGNSDSDSAPQYVMWPTV